MANASKPATTATGQKVELDLPTNEPQANLPVESSPIDAFVNDAPKSPRRIMLNSRSISASRKKTAHARGASWCPLPRSSRSERAG